MRTSYQDKMIQVDVDDQAHPKFISLIENLVEMMSPTYFEIIALFHKRLPNAFLAQIRLQLDVLEKKNMEFDLGRIMN